MIRLRKRFIRMLAGRMGVCLNCMLINDPKRGPGIVYASEHGGMCENLTMD